MKKLSRDDDFHGKASGAARRRRSRQWRRCSSSRLRLTRRGFEVPKLKNKGVFLDIFDAAVPLGEAILARRKRVSHGQSPTLVPVRR
jgi:hypothetical protein